MGIVIKRKEFALNHNFYTLIIYGFLASEDAVPLNKAIEIGRASCRETV